MADLLPVNDPAQTAAQMLVERRSSGRAGARFDLALRPSSLEQALAIQEAGATLWCARHNDRIGAWKAGLPLLNPATPGELQRLVLAPIFASTIHRSTAVPVWPGRGRVHGAPVARIEPELAFVLATDLPARAQPYAREEVAAAVGKVHMALELINCRYAEPGDCEFVEKLADCLENQGLFIGPEIDKQAAFNAAALSLTLTVNGDTRSLEGRHPANDPVAPLYWLAEFLRSRGQGLQAGQAVITGCYSATVLEVPLHQPISLVFTNDGRQRLGELHVEFRPNEQLEEQLKELTEQLKEECSHD